MMLCLCSSSSSTLLSLKPLITQRRALSSSSSLSLLTLKNLKKKKKIFKGICRAELSHDAPFVAAIGACMLSSLVLPYPDNKEDESGAAMDSTDTRLAVMGIVSFIPYFNWLSWVFAWLDTGKRRYAVYALVYLAPYLRTNLSLSPEDSWLPIASIVLGIIHIQLEASIRNGDIQGFQFFNETAKHFRQSKKEKGIRSKRHDETPKEEKQSNTNLPSAKDKSRNDIREWGVPQKPSEDSEHPNGDSDDDERRKH